ncbi:MAG TPA: non-canonical purine NTP pyrophosphatase [Candidatus Saccharimonadales bacterium]
MNNVVFVTGNPDKAARFAMHMGMDIAHEPAELDEIQTLNPAALVGHKARQAHEQIGKPVLVEDVTFTYEAWGELPGAFVKFFVEADDGAEKMCRMLDGFDNRRAEGRCTFGYFDGHELKLFSGAVQGTVAKHPRGNGGYGFDRIFEIDGANGRTAAELTEAEYEEYYMTIKPFTEVRRFLESL